MSDERKVQTNVPLWWTHGSRNNTDGCLNSSTCPTEFCDDLFVGQSRKGLFKTTQKESQSLDESELTEWDQV